MKILVIDDNEAKRTRVKQVLRDGFDTRPPDVVEAEDYEAAIRALEGSHFDLVILDLVLPGAGNDASQQTSRAIMRTVLQGTHAFPPTHIIGLTAYEEVAREELEFYAENLLSLEIYSDVDHGWAERLVAKIRYLIKSKQAATNFQANSFDYDLVILVARYEHEYLPIVSNLIPVTEAESHPLWKGKVSFGTIAIPGQRSLRTAICCIGEMGMAPAAAVAAQAIALFRPRLISMLGMCCGFSVQECASPRKMMDAIVVREVACWEEGRYQDESKNHSEFKNRAKVRRIDDRIRDAVTQAIEAGVDTIQPSLRMLAASVSYNEARDHFGAETVREIPDVQFAPIVSGSSVIADKSMILEILGRHPSALGLDMELYGVYCAVESSFGKRPSVLGIKGVADFGDLEKDKKAQANASIVSAEVLKSLLPHLPIWCQ